jgi:hypothetical protein
MAIMGALTHLPRNTLASLLGTQYAPPSLGSTILTGIYEQPTSARSLARLLSPAQPVSHEWQYVTRRFTALITSLQITERQHQDGLTKFAGIAACLNRHYWGHGSESMNSTFIGSWGKETRVRPSRDVDMLFVLPNEVYWRFQQRNGNRQSQLLQEVKDILAQTYSQTTMRGDGQVVCIPFESTPVEVSPAFRCDDGRILTCDANDGGAYKYSTAAAERSELDASDAMSNHETRHLARMMKCWQRTQNVALKSFQIERLAIEFMKTWHYRGRGFIWYDWMIRDFFSFLIARANWDVIMPGTGERIPLRNEWLSKAQTAYRHALRACDNERGNYEALAGGDWQEIFGSAVPVLIS